MPACVVTSDPEAITTGKKLCEQIQKKYYDIAQKNKNSTIIETS